MQDTARKRNDSGNFQNVKHERKFHCFYAINTPQFQLVIFFMLDKSVEFDVFSLLFCLCCWASLAFVI